MLSPRLAAAVLFPLVLSGASVPVMRQTVPPIYFEPNLGQAPAGVSFFARTPHYQLRLTAKGADLLLREPALAGFCTAPGRSDPARLCRNREQRRGSTSLRFLRAREAPYAGSARRASTSNYLTGARPHWKTGIPHYQRVVQSGIYPGIDVAYYAQGSAIEFDLVVQPGGDASRITMKWESPARINSEGAIVISTAAGDLVQHRPVAFQLVAGKRAAVPARYYRRAEGFGVAVGEYDHRLPLVIDPVLTYSTYLGGTAASGEDARGLAVDSTGHAYVCGSTFSADFPTRAPMDGTIAGEDAFLLKLNPAGTDLVYATFLGGTGRDECHGVALDPQNNAYLMGITLSGDFPLVNALDATLGGTTDFFVSKVNAAGSALVYSTYLGGSGVEFQGEGNTIAVDERGYAYVGGYTSSTDYPTTEGAFSRDFGGQFDGVVSKLEPAGNALAFSLYLGGSGEDVLNGLTIDGASNVYVTGYTFSANFPVTAGAADTTLGEPDDTFITKINPAGSGLRYSTFLGGTPSDFGISIAVDPFGRAHVAGHTFAANFPATAGVLDSTHAGITDMFVAKLNSDGSAFHFATLLGGSGADFNTSIAIDAGGNIMVGGYTQSTNFPLTADNIDGTASANEGVLAVLDPRGTALRFSTYFGGLSNDQVARVAYNTANDAFFVGQTVLGIPTVAGSFDTTSNGQDAFAAKLSQFNYPVCNPAVSTANAVVPAEGLQGGQYTVTPSPACTWTAIAGHPGIVTLLAPITATLAGTLHYNVAANAGTGPRFISIATGNALHNIAQAGSSTNQVFTDVPTAHPFFQQILGLRDKAITQGCATDRYCPADTVTRGQMAAFLLRALAGDTFAFPAGQRFTDVPPSHPFFRFIQMMSVLGITSGCGNDRYCPDDPVTRGQMAVFVLRALAGNTFPFPETAAFTDVDQNHPFFRYVQGMLQRGITAGVGNNQYGVDQPVTREQMAAFLMRAFAVK